MPHHRYSALKTSKDPPGDYRPEIDTLRVEHGR